jgi:WD40 repeat protein
MARAAMVLILFAAPSAAAADLPSGAVARLGDDSFRAGRAVDGLAYSPDGKQLLSWQRPDQGLVTVALWDAESGKRLRAATVNSDLFCGAAWGPSGALVVVRRVEVDTKTGRASVLPDDVRVWNFADFASPPPPVLDRIPLERRGTATTWRADAARPDGLNEFREFAVAPDGRRLAVLSRGTLTKKFTVAVFDLHPADTIARLKRLAALAVDYGDFVSGLALTRGDHILQTSKANLVFQFGGIGGTDWKSPRAELLVWDLNATKWGPKRFVASRVSEMGLSWDGHTVAIRSDENADAIALVDPATGKDRAKIPWPKDRRAGREFNDVLAFSPDDKQLLVTVQNGAALLDVVTGKERGRIEGHAGDMTAFAFSPDGTRIATADDKGLIRTWDAETLRPRSKPVGHRAPICSAELAPDGKRLLTWAGLDDTVFVWDLASGTPLRGFTSDFVSEYLGRPAFTPDGLSVVVCTKERLVARDIQTGLERPLPEEMAQMRCGGVVFAPTGTAVLTYPLNSDVLTVWDWPGGKKRFSQTAQDERYPAWPGFSADGKIVYPSARSPARWDATTGRPLTAAWGPEAYTCLLAALRHCPEFVYNEEKPGTFVLREVGTGKPVPRFRFRDPADERLRSPSYWPAFAPDGRFIAACSAADGTGWLVEPATGATRRELVCDRGFVRALGFTPDGKYLLTAHDDHTILVWDLRLQAVPLPNALKRETDAAKLWDTLATGKADAAYLAMARLAREPPAAVKMARLRIAPVVPPSAETIARIVDDLADADYRVREKATRELERWGEIAVGPVRERLSGLSSAEARMRCETFVKSFTGGSGAAAARLADARAIELLESLGTDESRALLKELASGHADAFRTQEARRALDRK